ncbi:hypothetical protein CUMW_072210 [Citrus unshiu]|nr:hypothetical protein CUMW_072210 [Citrus unshiu]
MASREAGPSPLVPSVIMIILGMVIIGPNISLVIALLLLILLLVQLFSTLSSTSPAPPPPFSPAVNDQSSSSGHDAEGFSLGAFLAAAAAAKHESTEEFLEHKRKKRWIDNKSGYNCFMLYPRSLYGCHWSNRQYWDWRCFKETRSGETNLRVLAGPPVILKLTLPTGKVQNRQVSLLEKPRGQWIELSVGIFLTDQNIYGSSSSSSETAAVSFSLYPDCRPLEIWSYN